MAPRERSAKRALAERMWEDGESPEEIVAAMGWSTNVPASSLISHYRNNKGWAFPVRDRGRSRGIAAAHARRRSSRPAA